MRKTQNLRPRINLPVQPDCIAFCSPGISLTVLLLIERVLLSPVKGTDADRPRITANELYDCLLKPESGPINRLLFVSPHSLFDPTAPSESFSKHAQSGSLADEAEENWHFPIQPSPGTNDVSVLLYKRDYASRNPGPFQRFDGVLRKAELAIPKELCSSEASVVLAGLGRSVFECHFDPPIPAGQKTWLRILINPRRLSLPDPAKYQGLDSVGLQVYSQFLDVLAPETMLEAFRDLLVNAQAVEGLPPEIAEPLQESVFKTGLEEVKRYVFSAGFDATGTYTRIEDHRILVGSGSCRLNLIKEEGSVDLQAISPVTISGSDARVYHWYSGTKGYPHLDPVTSAEKLYKYVAEYARDTNSAKSKVELTYATQVEHLLGCEIIDEFTKGKYFLEKTSKGAEGGEKLYWLNLEGLLPSSETAQYDILTGIAVSISNRTRLPRGHFRIFFEALWWENTSV